MKTKTIKIRGSEFPSAHEAIQDCDASGWDCAIRIGGKNICMMQQEADRLAADGIAFAYLCDHEMPDGSWRIMTIPVN
jgi:hypothetical protein